MTKVTSTMAKVREEFPQHVLVEDEREAARAYARVLAGRRSLCVSGTSSFAGDLNQFPIDVIAASAAPPVDICRSKTTPQAANSALASQTPTTAGSLFWRASAVPVEERK